MKGILENVAGLSHEVARGLYRQVIDPALDRDNFLDRLYSVPYDVVEFCATASTLCCVLDEMLVQNRLLRQVYPYI